MATYVEFVGRDISNNARTEQVFAWEGGVVSLTLLPAGLQVRLDASSYHMCLSRPVAFLAAESAGAKPIGMLDLVPQMSDEVGVAFMVSRKNLASLVMKSAGVGVFRDLDDTGVEGLRAWPDFQQLLVLDQVFSFKPFGEKLEADYLTLNIRMFHFSDPSEQT